jgi:hypothetical protein
MFRKDYLEKYKVNLFVGEHGGKIDFESTEDKLTYDILSRLSQYENEKRISRSQSGKRYLLDKVSKHKAVYLGGTATFGYENINKEWAVLLRRELRQRVMQLTQDSSTVFLVKENGKARLM